MTRDRFTTLALVVVGVLLLLNLIRLGHGLPRQRTVREPSSTRCSKTGTRIRRR